MITLQIKIEVQPNGDMLVTDTTPEGQVCKHSETEYAKRISRAWKDAMPEIMKDLGGETMISRRIS